MGGGILPVSFYKGNMYFLFSRETMDARKDPGKWSDFGGSRDKNETPWQTAVREGWEESAGFLGNKKDIIHLMRYHKIKKITMGKYTTYMVHIPYNPKLPEAFFK